MPVFSIFLLSPGRDINKKWHTQKGFKNKKEGTLKKQADGNNSNKTEAKEIASQKNMLDASHKHKLSSEILN